MNPRRKCFISYHHADEAYVKLFVDTFDHGSNLFIVRRLGEMPTDVVNSNNTDYVMSRIRKDYIADSTVTILLAGPTTWSRRYVDWELQASLRQGLSLPNGLLGIKLPGFTKFPERFSANLTNYGDTPNQNFASHIPWPNSEKMLVDAIEYAYNRRLSHAKYRKNAV
jgi:hypothetical protein